MSLPAPAFDGPLDFLLEEARRQNVALDQIALAPLVARYLDYLATAPADLNGNIEWLHMAATLIYWKSRSLLPAAPLLPPAADSIRDELIRQLIVHRAAAARELERRRAVEESHLTRQPPAGAPAPASSTTTVWEMIRQARDLAEWAHRHRPQPGQPPPDLVIESESCPVEEMAAQVRAALTPGTRRNGLQWMEQEPSACRRATLFLAFLDLTRDGELEIHQPASLEEFWVGVRL